jgi:hypothetical protein
MLRVLWMLQLPCLAQCAACVYFIVFAPVLLQGKNLATVVKKLTA